MCIFNWAWANVSDKQIPYERFSKALSTQRKLFDLLFQQHLSKAGIQCLIFITSLLYLRLKFMIIFFLSLVEDTLGTSEENGMMVGQALEEIQYSTHSAVNLEVFKLGYNKWHICASNIGHQVHKRNTTTNQDMYWPSHSNSMRLQCPTLFQIISEQLIQTKM